MAPTIKVHGRVIPLSYVNGEWRANVEIHLRDTDNEGRNFAACGIPARS